MAAHYIIDGYNVIRAVDWLSAGTLQAQRERLLRFIEEKHPQGSPRNLVTVVFDGQPDVHGPPWKGPTRVIFSEGPDADAIIKNLVDMMKHPAEAVVVTNDKAIQKWVRGAKARVMGCEDFLRPPTGRRPTKDGATKPEAKNASEITDEMRRVWKIR